MTFKITAKEKRFILKRRKVLSSTGWLDIAKEVVKEGQMTYINLKTLKTSEEKKKGMVILDATTAAMLVNIADNLTGEVKKKFTSLPLDKAINVGWQIMRK